MRSTCWLGLVAAMIVGGCGDDQHETTLQWYRAPCQGPFPRLCPFDRDATGQLHIIYDGIVGYQATWGVEADVRYHIEPGSGDPDADSVDYWVVDRVLAERQVAPGTTIRWWVDAGATWFTAVGDHVEAFAEPVACEPALCAQLITVDPVAQRLVDVAYTGDPALPLRAISVSAR